MAEGGQPQERSPVLWEREDGKVNLYEKREEPGGLEK